MKMLYIKEIKMEIIPPGDLMIVIELTDEVTTSNYFKYIFYHGGEYDKSMLVEKKN